MREREKMSWGVERGGGGEERVRGGGWERSVSVFFRCFFVGFWVGKEADTSSFGYLVDLTKLNIHRGEEEGEEGEEEETCFLLPLDRSWRWDRERTTNEDGRTMDESEFFSLSFQSSLHSEEKIPQSSQSSSSQTTLPSLPPCCASDLSFPSFQAK